MIGKIKEKKKESCNVGLHTKNDTIRTLTDCNFTFLVCNISTVFYHNAISVIILLHFELRIIQNVYLCV